MGKTSVTDWTEALPLVKGVHLKFWDADDEGAAISGPMGELIAALEALGFNGYFTSEWGGHEWLDSSVPSATMVAAQKKIFEQIVGTSN
jgi:alkanesulfonate monooxygenase SsuD/methylene tetrahydromethanopterin reductase-like flavin-dependent oxidoreductase (luciferase family)